MLWLRLTSLIVVPLLVDELGLALYGVWALSDILVSGQGLIDVGMLNATVKFVADADARHDTAAGRSVVRLSLLWYTILNVVVITVVAALLGPLPGWLDVHGPLVDDARVLLGGAAVIFAVSNYAYVFGHALLGLQEAAIVNIVYSVSRLPYLVIIGVTVAAGWGVWGVVVAGLLMYAIQTIWLAKVVRHRLPPTAGGGGSTVSARELARFGSRTYVATVADFVVLQVPKLAAARIAGARSAGRYDLATRLPVVAAASAYPLQGPALAAAARLAAHGRHDDATSLAARATRVLLVVLLPLFGAIFIAGPEVLEWWVGDDGAGLEAPLRLVLPGLLLTTAAVGVLSALTGTGAPGAVARYKLVLLVATVALVSVGGALEDLAGISAGLSMAAAIATLYLLMIVRRAFGVSGLRELAVASARPALAALAGALVATLFAISGLGGWPWVPALALVVTTAALWRPTRAVEPSDVAAVRDALARQPSDR